MKAMTSVIAALRNTLNFSGRMKRFEFWSFAVVGLVVAFSGLFSAIEGFLSDVTFELGVGDELWEWMARVGAVIVAVPWISAAVRRGHDSGFSSWKILAGLALPLPFLGIAEGIEIALFLENGGTSSSHSALAFLSTMLAIFALAVLAWLAYVLSRPSQLGPNKYGPNPHEVTS